MGQSKYQFFTYSIRNTVERILGWQNSKSVRQQEKTKKQAASLQKIFQRLQRIMSLIQFLQQTIIKDVSHHMLQQIQNQHSASESLLDTLSCLRQLNKLPILQGKILKANEYLQIKQQIFRCMNSIDNQALERWVDTIFKDNTIVSEFIKIERTKIEAMIINAIRQIFVPNMRSSYEQNQQNKTVNQYIFMLNELKNYEIQNKKPNRQQVIQISQLDERFQQYLTRFQQKISRFNKSVEQYIMKLKLHEQKIKREFRQLINFQPTKNFRNDEGQTPLKQLQDQKQSQYSNKYDNGYDDFYRPQTRLHFDSRYELPTRDIAYPFDTI